MYNIRIIKPLSMSEHLLLKLTIARSQLITSLLVATDNTDNIKTETTSNSPKHGRYF